MKLTVSKSKAFVHEGKTRGSRNHFTPSKNKIDSPEVGGGWRSLDDYLREMTMLTWLQAIKDSDPDYDYKIYWIKYDQLIFALLRYDQALYSIIYTVDSDQLTNGDFKPAISTENCVSSSKSIRKALVQVNAQTNAYILLACHRETSEILQ